MIHHKELGETFIKVDDLLLLAEILKLNFSLYLLVHLIIQIQDYLVQLLKTISFPQVCFDFFKNLKYLYYFNNSVKLFLLNLKYQLNCNFHIQILYCQFVINFSYVYFLLYLKIYLTKPAKEKNIATIMLSCLIFSYYNEFNQ